MADHDTLECPKRDATELDIWPLRDSAISLSGRTILVVGDVMLDEFICGEANRISSEAPVPVIEFRSRTYRPGGAANVSANIASLGSTAILAGVVGNDASGKTLLSDLNGRGVDTSVSAQQGRS